jgi:uncharacterized protein (DUF924 family)
MMLWLFNSAHAAEGLGFSTREGYAELMLAAGRGPRGFDPQPRTLSPAEACAVIRFWVEAGSKEWFAKRPEFDHEFRKRFEALHGRAARAEHGHADSADESLALLLLLDQFPRHAHRGTPWMYATDALARSIAETALSHKHDQMFEPDLRLFFYLPFAHSEALADQERSVALCSALPEPCPSNATRHRDIIRRFGRFPHRNPILGRAMRPEERAFLDEGGFAG